MSVLLFYTTIRGVKFHLKIFLTFFSPQSISWIEQILVENLFNVLLFPWQLFSPLFCFRNFVENNKIIRTRKFLQLSSPPPLDEKFVLWRQVEMLNHTKNNYSFHAWTVIGDNWFFPDHNNSVIRCLRWNCISCSLIAALRKQLSIQNPAKNYKARMWCSSIKAMRINFYGISR